MVDYGNPMPTATVPSPNAGVVTSGRNCRWKFLASLAGDRVLPAAATALLIAGQVAITVVILPKASRPPLDAEALMTILNRLLGLAFLILVAVLFVVRLPARRGERRPHVVAVAWLGSFSILAGALFAPLFGSIPLGGPIAAVGGILAALGSALGLWSLVHLGRSFAILPEARRLVTQGPYSITRNPLYTGEFVAGIGILLPGFSVFSATVLVVFLTCQLCRIHWEEKALTTAFGSEFELYRARIPRLLPHLRPTL